MITDEQLREAFSNAKSQGNAEAQARIGQEMVRRYETVRQTERKPAESFNAGKMVENIPTSLAQYGLDTVGAITSPYDTSKAILQAAGGAASKIPMVGEQFPSLKQYEPMADSIGQMYKDKYGSLNQIGASLSNDPIGTMADASIVGAATKIPALSKAALALNPTNLIYNSTKKGVQKAIPKNFAENQYQSAVKFDTVTDPAGKSRITNAALDNQIMPTESGIAKAKDKINQLGDEIRLGVEGATGTVPRQSLYQKVPEVRKKYGGMNIEAPRDIKLIDDYVAKYNKYLDGIGADRLTASQLQELKQSVWGEIYSDRVKQQTFKAVDSTREAIGQKSAQMIDELAPNTAKLNKQQGDLLELMKQLPKKSQRIANRNNVSLATGGNTMAGHAVGHTLGMPLVGTAVGLLGSHLDMPLPKAKLALEAHKLKNKQGILTDNNLTPAMLRELSTNMEEYQRTQRQKGLL